MLIWTRTSRQRVSRVFPSNLVFRRRPFTEVVNLPSPDPRAPVPIPQPLDYPRMDVTFLGTCSGGGPTLARNCSSLVVRALKDDTLWMVDCAEGTARQFLFQPYTPSRNNPKLYRLSKIFITHMHADHIMGIIPLLRNLLLPPPVRPVPGNSQPKAPKIELFGPAGLRTFVRSVMAMTFSNTAEKYCVHELLRVEDHVTSCDPEVLHSSETPGRDIPCDSEGFWRSFTVGKGTLGDVYMDAGPILHRAPSLGYIVRESVKPFRKIAILGDTYDASHLIPLCTEPSPSLLIHEATDAFISPSIDPKAKRTLEIVKENTLARGHSMPEQAGAFARVVGAKRLVLNHISGRFPTPGPHESIRENVIREIERQATSAWGMGQARAAWDYMCVTVPISPEEDSERGGRSSTLGGDPGDGDMHADPFELKDYNGNQHHNNQRKRRR